MRIARWIGLRLGVAGAAFLVYRLVTVRRKDESFSVPVEGEAQAA